MKALFVSPLQQNTMFGGDVCSKRNYDSLKNVLGKESVILYSLFPVYSSTLKAKIQRIVEIFQCFMLTMNRLKVEEIIETIDNNDITLLVLDSSLLGRLAKSIKAKRPEVKIITMFHNLEVKFLFDFVRVNRDVSRFFWVILAYINERLTCKYSDIITVLNERDNRGVKKYYNRSADIIIPISLAKPEGLSYNSNHNYIESDLPLVLFVGSYFYANIEAVKWFVENVLIHVNVKFVVVGKGMEKLRESFSNVEIYSNVDDLTPFYQSANIVVMPIFSGSGMKIKTAESLMYGKRILGTKEAKQGYDLSSDIFIECNSAPEFIQELNKISLEDDKFNMNSHKRFEESYSFDATLVLFKQLLHLL